MIHDIFTIPGTAFLPGITLSGQNLKLEAVPIADLEHVVPLCRCGIPMHRNGFRSHDVADMPIRGKHVLVTIHRLAFRCATGACKMTTKNPIAGSQPRARISSALAEYIGVHALYEPFKVVADRTGVDASTVSRHFVITAKAALKAEAAPTPRIPLWTS